MTRKQATAAYLTDLKPQFIQLTDTRGGHRHVNTLGDADGIRFLCPKCFKTNAGAVGTHEVICWFEDRVPDDVRPGPGRWMPAGSTYADLSFVPGKRSPSIQLTGGCGWHGFITHGKVTDA